MADIPSSQPLSKRHPDPPSSPPTMPFMSTAVSSVPHVSSPKRKRAAEMSVNVFVEESDDEDENIDPQSHASPKRTRIGTEGQRSHPEVQEQVVEQLRASEISLPVSQQPPHSQTSQSQDLGLSLFAKRLVSNPLFASGNTPSTPSVAIRTSSGKSFAIRKKPATESAPFERLAASRSEVVQGKAQRSYYGINIHELVKEAKAQQIIDDAEAERRNALPSKEPVPVIVTDQKSQPTLMWTEKYRARKFTDLVGDDRTHRTVMHWLKRWDEVVFPGSSRPKSKLRKNADNATEERPHRKILLLTGPPGLGKTTLAHVCARQAGYEVQEINASDERSRDVVKGRIRDMVGTENVRGVDTKTSAGKVRKAGRPVCVVVDEVDGVVGGSGGGGEGGFVKALIDLVNLDQRNSKGARPQQSAGKKKGDNFRLLRPLILICNDVYHPSLRPLRQSSIAEIIHVRKPAITTVVTRMQSIFEKENIPFDGDGVRKLCEASWGITSRKEGGTGSSTGEGDIRGILVVCEWIAGRLRATHDPTANSMQRLTRRWIEDNVMADLSHGGGSARALGRGGPREVADRVFKEGAGFSKPTTLAAPTNNASIEGVKGVAEAAKQQALNRLREMIDTSGDIDRIVTDCFSAYPEHPYQDDNYLSKPSEAYDWLFFHDKLSSAVFSNSEWELASYLSHPILAFHNLFATATSARFSKPANWSAEEAIAEDGQEPTPFSGPQASFQAHEAQKSNMACLQTLQASLSLPLIRMFPAPSAISTDFIPYIVRMVSPSINPVIVHNSGTSTASVRKASEKLLVSRAINAMAAAGIRFDRVRIDTEGSFTSGPTQWIYRMEPGLDDLSSFPTLDAKAAGLTPTDRTRFAVRQVLDQELTIETKRAAETARLNRGGGGGGAAIAQAPANTVPAPLKSKLKRDFFGRILVEKELSEEDRRKEEEGVQQWKKAKVVTEESNRVWVTFHEGFSNAVRKPVSMRELLGGI